MFDRFLGRKLPKRRDKIATTAAEIRLLREQYEKAQEAALTSAKEGGHLDLLSAIVLSKVSQQ